MSVSYNAPAFMTDPNYGAAQGSLMPFASSLMTGQGLPPAYAGLGQPNSPQFQALLQRVTGNILGSTQAAMGGQGLGNSGVALSAEAGAVGDATSQLSYQDFMNSQSQQMQMMGMGSGIMQNIGSMALNNQGQENQFNLTNASESLNASEFNSNLKQQQAQALMQMISGGISAAGNLAGMAMLGGMGGGGGTSGYSFSPMPGAGGSGGGGPLINNSGYGF